MREKASVFVRERTRFTWNHPSFIWTKFPSCSLQIHGHVWQILRKCAYYRVNLNVSGEIPGLDELCGTSRCRRSDLESSEASLHSSLGSSIWSGDVVIVFVFVLRGREHGPDQPRADLPPGAKMFLAVPHFSPPRNVLKIWGDPRSAWGQSLAMLCSERTKGLQINGGQCKLSQR